MDVAAGIVAAGNPEGIVGVIAGAQVAGRGRLGRVWQTFPWQSLAVTLMVPMVGEHLPLLAALAVYDFVRGELGPDDTRTVALKWPNDVLVGGKKVAGILIETVVGPGGVRVALVGVGVNLTAPEDVPAAFMGTFVHPADQMVLAEPALLQKATQLHTCMMQQIDLYREHGWTPELHDSYTRVCATLGGPVKWVGATGGENAPTLTGTARGLTQSGHLELVAEDGTVHILHSGQIMETHTTA